MFLSFLLFLLFLQNLLEVDEIKQIVTFPVTYIENIPVIEFNLTEASKPLYLIISFFTTDTIIFPACSSFKWGQNLLFIPINGLVCAPEILNQLSSRACKCVGSGSNETKLKQNNLVMYIHRQDGHVIIKGETVKTGINFTPFVFNIPNLWLERLDVTRTSGFLGFSPFLNPQNHGIRLPMYDFQYSYFTEEERKNWATTNLLNSLVAAGKISRRTVFFDPFVQKIIIGSSQERQYPTKYFFLNLVKNAREYLTYGFMAKKLLLFSLPKVAPNRVEIIDDKEIVLKPLKSIFSVDLSVHTILIDLALEKSLVNKSIYTSIKKNISENIADDSAPYLFIEFNDGNNNKYLSINQKLSYIDESRSMIVTNPDGTSNFVHDEVETKIFVILGRDALDVIRFGIDYDKDYIFFEKKLLGDITPENDSDFSYTRKKGTGMNFDSFSESNA